MVIPNVARRDLSPRKIKEKNFRKYMRATNPPKTDDEGKKINASKRKNPQDPIIPSWRR